MELLKLWDMIVRRKAIFIAIVLTVVLVPVIGSFLVTPVYKCSSKVWIKYKSITPSLVIPSLPADFGKLSYSSSDYLADTIVALIESRPVIDNVIKDLDLKDKNGNHFDINAFVEPGFMKKVWTLKTGLEAVQIEDSELFEIKAYSGNVEEAARIANAVAGRFLDLFADVNSKDVGMSVKILEVQVERVRRNWNDAEQERLQFRANKLAVDLDKQKSDLLTSMTTLQDQKRVNQISFEADRATMSSIEDTLKKQPEYKPQEVTSGIENLSSITTYKNKLYDLELSLAEKRTQMKEAHPTVSSLQSQIEYTKNAIRTMLYKSVTSDSIAHTTYFDTLVQKYGDSLIDMTSLSAKNQAIGVQVRNLEISQRAILETEHAYIRIAQKSDNLKTVLTSLLQQMEYAKIAQTISLTNATIVDYATVPGKTNMKRYLYFPKKTLILFVSLFIGTLLGLCVVLFLDYTDDTFRTRGEIENDLKLPVLVSIPDKKV